MRGEMMIGHHEYFSSVAEIINSGRQMIFVDGPKTIDPREFFGSYKEKRGKQIEEKFIWDDIIEADLSLGQLYDMLEAGKRGTKPGKVYDVVVDMYENPNIKDKTGENQDVWIVDNLVEC